MTQEQKAKMEQEVRAYTIPYIRNHGQRMGDIVKQDFTSIYQTILENPQEWGLVSQKKAFDLAKDEIQLYKGEIDVSYDIIKGQIMKIKKYRDALDRIIIESEDNEQVDWMYVAENMVDIAKEAL